MERKLGIIAHCLNGCSELDALSLIKEAGFAYGDMVNAAIFHNGEKVFDQQVHQQQ